MVDGAMTYEDIIARLDEHDPQCVVQADLTVGGFWSATVRELRAYLANGMIDPEQIASRDFVRPAKEGSRS